MYFRNKLQIHLGNHKILEMYLIAFQFHGSMATEMELDLVNWAKGVGNE